MKEVILLACGFSAQHCPYDKEVWAMARAGEIGLLNQTKYMQPARIDKLFEMHQKNDKGTVRLENFTKIQLKYGCEIYTVKKLPMCEYKWYPTQTILKRFNRHYFNTTVPWMMALAIFEGYERIDMYGIDFAGNKERVSERGGTEYWIGLAEGMGIDVRVGRGSPLCKKMYYGFLDEVDNAFEKDLRIGALTPYSQDVVTLATMDAQRNDGRVLVPAGQQNGKRLKVKVKRR